MSTKENFLQRLAGVFSQRDETELPPEVSEKANYRYSNFRGLEPFSYGPRDERKEQDEREFEVYTSLTQPQVEFCRCQN
jgi:hypothetical protein